MSLSRETLLDLMALADGELDGPAKERMEQLVAERSEARLVVDAIRAPHLREWLGHASKERARMADGIVDAVMASLKEGHPAARRRTPSRPERSPAPRARAVALGAAIAVAASVALLVRPAKRLDHRGAVGGIAASSAQAGVVQSTAAVAVGEIGGHGVEVEDVDSTAQVSIFAIAGASMASSVVVWIDDERGKK